MIRYQDNLTSITSEKLRGFFVGWPNPPSSETHLKVLRNSSYLLLAIDGETDNVIGFITAISDGVLSAYIPLLEVLPEYQFRGIGTELVERMLARLKGLYAIDLMCDPKLVRGYESFGFRRCTGMAIRNFAAQSGKLSE